MAGPVLFAAMEYDAGGFGNWLHSLPSCPATPRLLAVTPPHCLRERHSGRLALVAARDRTHSRSNWPRLVRSLHRQSPN